MSDYRVKLDIYDGPLDLLLYLTRREEIDIHDIPIALITEQYCAHLAVLRQIDPDLAGEFLVMAATLMEIKTRMLLPAPEVEGDQDAEPFDPRAELVRQLLEYKVFKDAAGELREAAARQSLRFPRRPGQAAPDDEKDLEEVQLWDLVEAFNAVMASIGRSITRHEIIRDDTPVELHVEDILDRLARDGDMRFGDIFAGRTQRTELVGLFLALLELIRRRAIFVEQETHFGEIYVYLNPDPPPPAEVERAGQAAPEPPTDAPTGMTGRYVSDRASESEDDDDARAAADGVGD